MRKTVLNPARLAIVFVFLIALMAFTPAVAASSTSAKVQILGTEQLRINQKVFATFRFNHDVIRVVNGASVTFENLKTDEPHTVSLVSNPPSAEEIFSCGAPGTICFTILATHVPNGVDANGNPIPPIFQFVTVAGNPSGFEGGNSVLLFPGQTFTVTISADPGTTLHYFCAIHAWMQATIEVES